MKQNQQAQLQPSSAFASSLSFKIVPFCSVGCSWQVCSDLWRKYSQPSVLLLPSLHHLYFSHTRNLIFLSSFKPSVIFWHLQNVKPVYLNCLLEQLYLLGLHVVVCLQGSRQWPLPWRFSCRPVISQAVQVIMCGDVNQPATKTYEQSDSQNGLLIKATCSTFNFSTCQHWQKKNLNLILTRRGWWVGIRLRWMVESQLTSLNF